MKKQNKIRASTAATPSTYITPSNPKRDNEKLDRDNAKWVKFYKDNNIYVNDLSLRSKRSGTHGSILLDKLTFATGSDLLFYKSNGDQLKFKDLNSEQQKYVQSVNKYGDSLHDIIRSILRGYIFSGNGYVQVSEAQGRVMLFKQDFTQPRIFKNRQGFALSSYWRDILTTDNPDRKRYPITEIEAFDFNKQSSKTKLVHLKADTEESDFYGLPDHIAALKWADIEYRIPTHNLTKFDNGFMPSGTLSMFGDPPKGMDEQQYVDAVREKFTGENNNDKVIVELLDSPDQKSIWTQFNLEKDGEFQELQNLAVQNIITAHRWDGNLLGVQTPGKLGGESKQIRTSFERIYNTVIFDYQRPVLNFVNKLIQRMPLFKDIKVGIASPSPVGFSGDIDINAILTVNEGYEAIGYEKTTDPRGNEPIKKQNGSQQANNSGTGN